MLNLDKNKELNKQVNDYVNQFFDNHEKTGQMFFSEIQEGTPLQKMVLQSGYDKIKSSSGHTLEVASAANSGAALKSDGNKMVWSIDYKRKKFVPLKD